MKQFTIVMLWACIICKYYMFPIGHLVIHVGDTCKNVQACLHIDGLMKCTIVPPKNLFPPVLPFRCKKMLLSVCVERASFVQNLHGECQHFSDAERAISGTWFIVEVWLAVENRYKILEIQEVYEYQITQYNQETGQGGLFDVYINTFLNLIALPGGYPSWVRTPNDEDKYIETFRQSEEILLDKDSIKHNAAKRGLAELCLNSMWCKLTENARKTQTILISDPQEIYSFLVTSGIEVMNLLFAGNEIVWISWRHAEGTHMPRKRKCRTYVTQMKWLGAT